MAVIRFPHSGDSDSSQQDFGYRDWEDEDEYIDEQVEASEHSRERRRDILRLILRIVCVLAAAGVVIVFVLYLSSQRVYSTASTQQIYAVSATEDVNYLALGSNIVYYSKDGASCISGKGNAVWSLSFEMQQPMVSTDGDYLAIGDYGGNTIYLQTSSSIVGTIDTNLPIRQLCVSESGRVAAVLEDSDVNWIYLYTPEGEAVSSFKLSMSGSGYPLSIAVSPSGELMCVSHLVVSSSGYSTSIAFHNFGSVGQNYADKYVSGFEFDEIFPYMLYMSDSVCVGVSDARLAFFTGKEIPLNSANVMISDEIVGVYASDDYIALLFLDDSGSEDYVLDVYDTSGNRTGEIAFSLDYTDIRMSGSLIYIYNDNDLLMYTVTGNLRYDGSFPENVYQVIPAASRQDRLYIVTETGIERMTLQ